MDKEPFHKATDDLAGMERELKTVNKSLQDMEKSGSGNAEQIAKYNELTARTAELPGAASPLAKKKSKRDLKPLSSKLRARNEAASRAKGFQEAIKGQGDQTLGQLTEAYHKDVENAIESDRVNMELRVQAIRQSNMNEQAKAKAVFEGAEALHEALPSTPC